MDQWPWVNPFLYLIRCFRYLTDESVIWEQKEFSKFVASFLDDLNDTIHASSRFLFFMFSLNKLIVSHLNSAVGARKNFLLSLCVSVHYNGGL